jgi:site-specific recombinase XerD
MVKGVIKKATLEEAVAAFIAHQRHEQRNIRTIYSDGQALRRFNDALKGAKTPMTELDTDAVKAYIGSFPPGTTRRTHYARIKKFISWAFREKYTATDVMAGSKPGKKDRYASNNKKIDVEAFRRILFVSAGLEPINPGEAPTDRYLRLLPFYVLGGMAGMRRCELIDSNPKDPVIEWRDIYWKKKLILVRHEVAKETPAEDRKRHIPLEQNAEDWLRLVAKPNGRIMDISQSTLQRLSGELLDALKLELPENGPRNSYASYGQSIRSPGEVAKAMGDSEATMKRWYIETLEPGEGHAWFAIRPGMEQKIIPITTAA